MYFDRKWWGIRNLDWVGFFLKEKRFLPVDRLLDKETFFSQDCAVTYPIMGAFTDWLISSYGIEQYMECNRAKDSGKALETVYQKTVKDLNQAFVDNVNFFRIDEALEKRTGALIS